MHLQKENKQKPKPGMVGQGGSCFSKSPRCVRPRLSFQEELMLLELCHQAYSLAWCHEFCWNSEPFIPHTIIGDTWPVSGKCYEHQHAQSLENLVVYCSPFQSSLQTMYPALHNLGSVSSFLRPVSSSTRDAALTAYP